MARRKKEDIIVNEEAINNTPAENSGNKVFSQRFSGLLETSGKTLTDVSKECNISKVSLSKYVSGNGTANGASLVKLADCFSVSTDYLLGHDNAKTKKEANAVERAAKLKVENDRLKRVLRSYESLHDELVSFNAAISSTT